MASYDIKKEIDTLFMSYTNAPVQFHGQNLDTVGMEKFISLIYAPIENTAYGLDGTATGRIRYAGMQKVFCYAANPTKALQLADNVKSFFNGKELSNNIHTRIGQDNMPVDLGNGFYEVLCTFELSQWD